MSEPTASAPRPSYGSLAVAFLRELFDLQFRSFIATRMLPGIFGFGIVLAVLFTGYMVYRNLREEWWEAALWIVLFGPAMFLGLVIALRVTLEFVMAVFRMAWYVEHVAGHAEEIGQNMPRFGFLRTLLYGEKGVPPAPGEKK